VGIAITRPGGPKRLVTPLELCTSIRYISLPNLMVLYQVRTSHSAKSLGSCVQYDRNLCVLFQCLFAWNNWRSERRTKRCQDIGMESASSVIRNMNGTTTYRWL